MDQTKSICRSDLRDMELVFLKKKKKKPTHLILSLRQGLLNLGNKNLIGDSKSKMPCPFLIS